jgi:hypothetical protein
MKILLILIPAPVVGYFMIDSVRKIFSEDDRLLRRVFADQPVTMIAAATALGSVAVWAVVMAVSRLFYLF